MLFAITTLVFVVVFLVFYVFALGGEKYSLSDKLKDIGKTSQPAYVNEELEQPLYKRIFGPPVQQASALILQFTPQAWRQKAERKLAASGGFHGMNTDQFVVFWFGMALFVALGFAGGAYLAKARPWWSVFAAAAVGYAIGYRIPLVLLDQRARVRQVSIQKMLPEVLDLLSVSVQAGLAFNGALAKVAEKMKGPLVDELTRMLQEMQMGMTRREALKSLSNRCNIQDVSLFTAALIQADQLGVSISNVLNIQSENMRERRRQRLREQALKAPIKMLFPLILCIFPAMFVVLLGPAVISLINNFLK